MYSFNKFMYTYVNCLLLINYAQYSEVLHFKRLLKVQVLAD